MTNLELTPVGEKAARFPLEPRLAKALIIAAETKCSEDAIVIAALLSTESIFIFPPKKREEAKEGHKKFHSADGDLISMLNIFKVNLQLHVKYTLYTQRFFNLNTDTRGF
jgi:HrpA-like RNA helicase